LKLELTMYHRLFIQMLLPRTELPKYAANKEKQGWEIIGKTQNGISILTVYPNNKPVL
jgi:hypothetical protein